MVYYETSRLWFRRVSVRALAAEGGQIVLFRATRKFDCPSGFASGHRSEFLYVFFFFFLISRADHKEELLCLWRRSCFLADGLFPFIFTVTGNPKKKN